MKFVPVEMYFSFATLRTPFELNTAAACSFVVLFEALVAVCISPVNGTLMCLLIGSVLYIEMCTLDIKLILDIDPLVMKKCSNSELIEYVKEAVVLHTRVIR